MGILDSTGKRARIVLVVSVSALLSGAASLAGGRVTLTGRVTDATGKPIEHATVMVYRAGVKKGYSTFCPTCYADCGKRAIADAQGIFTLKDLSLDLWFDLLLVGDGYAPIFVSKVDPSSGAPVIATLARRPIATAASQVFRGQVEDFRGLSVRDAVVQPKGVLRDTKTGDSIYGAIPGLDPIAVSNLEGNFEITASGPTISLGGSISIHFEPATRILVFIEARGMAPTFAVIPAGLEPHRIKMTEGATLRGRLVQDGKPVAGAEVGLIGRPRGGFDGNLQRVGYPYDEIRIGTQPDGTFAVTNVPAPADWYIYGKMESIATRGATEPVE